MKKKTTKRNVNTNIKTTEEKPVKKNDWEVCMLKDKQKQIWKQTLDETVSNFSN